MPTASANIGDVIIFLDRKMKRPADESGCNQFAVIINERDALFTRRRVHRMSVADLLALPNAKHCLSPVPEIRMEIGRFFERHGHSKAYVDAGLEALAKLNIGPFLMGDLFPTKPTYKSDTEYEEAWNRMVENMGPYDLLFTTDLTSRFSRFIGWYTHGPFSHSALYDGAGYLSEVVTSGFRYVPITTYKSRSNWVAAYRHIDNKGQAVEAAQAHLRKNSMGAGYNYRGAAWAGTKAFFGNHVGAQTPNGQIYQGLYYCIGQA
jgi:hypothetical protein